ncbi:MAG: hypothetical protein JW841_16010 [Deltaproteobacteria bacterium]|nr:hypothetical protein [Deltaproteobacteria bacterium]
MPRFFLVVWLAMGLSSMAYAAISFVPSGAKPPEIQVLNKNIDVFSKTNGKKTGMLSVGENIRIMDISGEWVSLDQKEGGWVKRGDLPTLMLLAHDYIPVIGSKPLFTIIPYSSKEYNSEVLFLFFGCGENYNFSEKVILNIAKAEMGGGEDGSSSPHYWVFNTKNPRFPFMILYSGHSGDMHHDTPALALFGGEEIRVWMPNPGNRIDVDFVGVVNDRLVINEALFCSFRVNTTLEITASGIKRVRGDFNKDQVLPPTGIQYTPEALIKDIRFYKNNKKTQYGLLKKGMVISSIIFLEADFSINDMVKVKINNKIGWVNIDELKNSCPMVYTFACCGCG